MEYLGAPVRGVLDRHDMLAIRTAIRAVIKENIDNPSEIDPDVLGRTVIRLYNMGLVDVEKLAEVAALMTMSRSSTCILRSGMTKSPT